MDRLIMILMACLPLSAAAQPVSTWARDWALSSAGAGGTQSGTVNPAAPIDRSSVAVGTGMLHSMPELMPVLLAVTDRRLGEWSVAALDLDGYAELRLRWRGAVSFVGHGIHVGMALGARTARIGSQPATLVTGADIGVRVRISRRVQIGAAARSLVPWGARRLSTDADPRSIGLAWKTAPTLQAYADWVRSHAGGDDLRLGTEWAVSSAVLLRAGWSHVASRPSVGIRVSSGRLDVDIAARDHDPLGWTWAVALYVYSGA